MYNATYMKSEMKPRIPVSGPKVDHKRKVPKPPAMKAAHTASDVESVPRTKGLSAVRRIRVFLPNFKHLVGTSQ